MTAYAVFLRGVNVGGINLKMAELRAAVETLDVSNVVTQLASGNLTCTTARSAAELKEAVESLLRSTFGYDAWVVILDANRLRVLVDACPFPTDDSTTHTYITLFSDPAALADLVDAVEKANTPQSDSPGVIDDFLVLGPEAAAWLAPRGGTLESPLSKLTAKPRFKNSTTTRNPRTLHKFLAALDA
ncbi:DUF1697 domain-containing protein [Arthrobacter sp. H20]|uniref:DUF1697 domain-containing protein n=1 Tax=Arthrobacter sp. H20 TaxID=1267981 RepID=UPI000479FF19|nr:DUF1697 domain-containing protein [Arthrobacter sp. H20]